MSLTERIAKWRWFRMTAALLVGSALFVLGVIYLNMTRQNDEPGFVVVGGTHAFAGRSLAARLSARGLKSKAPYPVQVDRVAIDGNEVSFEASQADPVVVQLQVPAALASRSAKLEFHVVSDGTERVLEHTLPVRQSVASAPAPSVSAASKRVAAEGKTRIDVIPEASVLAMGMRNQVLLRVRDSQGRSIKNAPVWVENAHFLVPPGRHKYTTDAMGLVEVQVLANAPNIDLGIVVVPPGRAAVEVVETLRPLGRQMLLSTENPVFRPGEPLAATLKTWRPLNTVHCDLLEEGTILWSGVVSTSKGATTTVAPPVGCNGLCHLQCAGHPWEPGDEFASIPLVVTSNDTLTAVTDLVAATNMLHLNSLQIQPGADPARTARYFLTFLQRPASSPSVWLNTLESDRGARDEVARAGKQRVLVAIGVVFLLIIFVVADVLIRNTAAQRQRMREFAAETLGEDLPASSPVLEAERGLERTRGVLLLLAMVGALVANLVGVIWLLALVGET